MIMDRCENARNYLGISAELDKALEVLAALSPGALPLGRVQLSGASYYTVAENELLAGRERFEFHRKYTDIHVPLTGDERIIISPISLLPEQTPFDEQKDIGHFAAEDVHTVNVPAGCFCVCFPQDAHKPLLGRGGEKILKAVFKVR